MLVKTFENFNENSNQDELKKRLFDKLKEKYDKEETSYSVKAILKDGIDIYLGASKKSLDEVVKSYTKKIENDSTNIEAEGYVYIIEETIKKRIIPKDELDPYVAAIKYNL